MYIWSRTRRLNIATLREGMGWCEEARQLAEEVGGHPFSLMQYVQGTPGPSIAWTVRVDSFGAMQAAGDAMAADPRYFEMVEAGAHLFEGPAEDLAMQVIDAHNFGPDDRPAYVSTTRATIAAGAFVKAVEWGAEVSAYAASVVQRPVVFGRAAYGTFGELGWVLGHESAEDIDVVNDKLNSDPGYIERIEAGGGYFVDGSGTTGLLRRMS